MIDSIKCLLRNKYWTETKVHEVLKESQANMKVSITNLPQGGIIIKVPQNATSSIMIDAGEDYNKSCDYLILLPDNNHIHAYFIELKKSLHHDKNGVPRQACQQILSTIPMLDYLCSMIKIHFEKTKDIQMHFTVIAEKYSEKLDKQGVKPSNHLKSVSYRNEKFKIIYSSLTIPLAHLR